MLLLTIELAKDDEVLDEQFKLDTSENWTILVQKCTTGHGSLVDSNVTWDAGRTEIDPYVQHILS